MSRTAELVMGMGKDVEKAFRYSPKGLCRVDEHGWLGLTGEPACADLNMAGLVAGAPSSAVEDYVGEIERLGLDAILIVDDAAEDLVAAATARGLTQVGAIPAMVWEGKAAPMPTERYKARIAERSDNEIANRLIASAFSLDEQVVQRAFPADTQQVCDVWLVEDGERALGCGWFVRTDDHVGIYCMATPAESQRKGVGRAVLDNAMSYYIDTGVTTFTLEATEAGFHLYEQIGFDVVASPLVFVAGASTQFPS